MGLYLPGERQARYYCATFPFSDTGKKKTEKSDAFLDWIAIYGNPVKSAYGGTFKTHFCEVLIFPRGELLIYLYLSVYERHIICVCRKPVVSPARVI